MNFRACLFGLQGYKGYSTLQGLHFSKIKRQYIDEFSSIPFWVTGLQGFKGYSTLQGLHFLKSE